MKIGLVCPYNITKGGGVQEVVQALQEGLSDLGHEALIITPRPRDIQKSIKNTILLGTGTDFKSPMATTSQISVSVDGAEIEEMLARENFDILHFHEPWIPVLSRQILSRSNCINIATFHAKLPETMMSRTVARVVTPYTKSVLKYLHGFTAVSEAAVEYLRSLTNEPVSIIPNGIDLQHYHVPRAGSVQKKDKSILYIGRLEKRKGVDRYKLEYMAEELGLRNVKFYGYVSETRKRQLFRTCDLFCSPALYGESFGIVLLEAMASGLVTVAGNNPGYAAVLQGLGSLSLVNPKDPEELAKRMELLLCEPQLRKLWLNWAKKTVPQYDYPAVVGQYESVYKSALAQYA
jgi:phosphatidylinositol alpha-mannosyltransferase